MTELEEYHRDTIVCTVCIERGHDPNTRCEHIIPYDPKTEEKVIVCDACLANGHEPDYYCDHLVPFDLMMLAETIKTLHRAGFYGKDPMDEDVPPLV